MGYRDDMERCRRYLLTQTSQELTAQELAQTFGYSYFHFCHVFKSVNGVSVGAFLRHRRLHNAALQLEEGKSVTAAAMENGFETVSGFARAFRQLFGVAPSVYQKRKGETLMIVPTFETKAAFTAVGYLLTADKDVDIQSEGAYWLGKDFSAVSPEDYARLCAPDYAEIGTWVQQKNGDGLCYFLGPNVESAAVIPNGMAALEFPAAAYAVFPVEKGETMQALHENVSKTWQYIFKDWFDASGYVFDDRARDFEWYHGADTKIFVPVVKKSER